MDLTKEFGKDSTTTLAIIMGHELAHYYKHHEWCSEFAFSVKGTDLGNKIINISRDQRKINESQADDAGLFAIMMAGYKPFNISPMSSSSKININGVTVVFCVYLIKYFM